MESNAFIWNKLRELQLRTRFSTKFKVESESSAKDMDLQASDTSLVIFFLSEFFPAHNDQNFNESSLTNRQATRHG